MHDPVCGLRIEAEDTRIVRRHHKDSYVFCSDRCAARFDADPQRYRGVPLIALRGVVKHFGEGETITRVLHGIDINVWEGDFVSLVGASGSGKSTVLNLIGNLDTPTAGTISIRGRDISRLSDDERAHLRADTFGFVFQQYNLVPWLRALDNALLPVMFAGKGRRENEARMKERFTELGLETRMEHRPSQLSGGEQQRVALLRAIANDPEIILGDEPTGNLDSVTGQKILATLKDLNTRLKKTLVIVTHDSSIATQADQMLVLKDGRMVRSGEGGKVFAH